MKSRCYNTHAVSADVPERCSLAVHCLAGPAQAVGWYDDTLIFPTRADHLYVHCREQCLREAGFGDIFKCMKQEENKKVGCLFHRHIICLCFFRTGQVLQSNIQDGTKLVLWLPCTSSIQNRCW